MSHPVPPSPLCLEPRGLAITLWVQAVENQSGAGEGWGHSQRPKEGPQLEEEAGAQALTS